VTTRIRPAIEADAEAFVGLHESVGFVSLGRYRAVGFKLGAWHDVGWWQATLSEPGCDPAEPRTFPAVLAELGLPQTLQT
jgi:hypothetical protein